MKLLSSQVDRFNELVFEHRNKDYGAYVIRKTYSDTMVKACFITFSAVALLLGSAIVANNLSSKMPLAEIPKTMDDTVWDTLDLDLNKEKKPEVQTEQRQQTQTPASAAPNTALPTEVIDDPVETHSVNVDDPSNGKGDPNAQGTSTTSTVTTTNTLTAVTPSTATVAAVPQEVVWSEIMPEFEGGINGLIRFLSANMIYPEQAKAIGKEGTVYISFVVDEKGYVTGAKVVKGIGFGCDEEALRVVNKIPKWKKAGMNAGQPVRVRFNLPVSFKLR